MIGSFTLIKNEREWIVPHLEAWLPVLSQMVFADGGSMDGTWEVLKWFEANHPHGKKLTLYTDDPKDLKDDYVRAFNVCLGKLKTDLGIFLHPDMYPSKLPKDFKHLEHCAAASTKMRSFAGEGGKLYEIKGRGEVWKNIYRLRNPDLGAKYVGHYGAHNEDVYLTAITGESYEHHGSNVHWYPYEVTESGIEILHFSDVRPVERRYARMVTCLTNQGKKNVEEQARKHPRVTLKDSPDFKFIPAQYPAEFLAAREKYKHLERSPSLV
jgi:hypothetical protein